MILPQCVYVMGVGHIGGSIALALRARNPDIKLIGYDQNPQHRAHVASWFDVIDTTPGQSLGEADILILSVPLAAYDCALRTVGKFVSSDTVITDVGSVKMGVYEQIMACFDNDRENIHCVPGHPIAGNEHSGPQAASADLFVDRYVVLTALDAGIKNHQYTRSQEKVASLWRQTGACVDIMHPLIHDHILALTSHLPHLLAFSFVASAQESALNGILDDYQPHRVDHDASKIEASLCALGEHKMVPTLLGQYSAGGFRDFTRIAASDPHMWTAIFNANRHIIAPILTDVIDDLIRLRDDLTAGDRMLAQERMKERLDRAQVMRKLVVSFKQAGVFYGTTPSPPPPSPSQQPESPPSPQLPDKRS